MTGNDVPQDAARLSRQEAHDLGMIIKERAKVLKAVIAERAAVCMANFDNKLAEHYAIEDATWRAIGEAAHDLAMNAEVALHARCKELGVPGQFAPVIRVEWAARGNAALEAHRAVMRRMAKSKVDAMSRAAEMRVERTSLDLRTQVVAMGLVSTEAKTFLESLATVEESMPMLEFRDVEIAAEQQQIKYRRGDFA